MTVKLKNNIVVEKIPFYAEPVSKWYGEEFAKQCVEAPEDVKCGMVYDPETNTFSELKEESVAQKEPTTAEILNALLGVTENE